MLPRSQAGLAGRWLRFLFALAVICAALAVLAQGARPPGIAGEIIERNLEHEVQATALFYMDLDQMPEIEARLARTRRSPSPEGR